MSKNISKEKRKLLNKLRLWLILHGYKNIEEFLVKTGKHYCEFCSHYTEKRMGCINQEKRLVINEKMSDIKKGYNHAGYGRCIEWVKYV